MKHIGIVVAAGKGLRVGGEIPKQYMDLSGKPVIYYCLKAMQDSFIDEIILVCGSGDEVYVRENIVDRFSFDKVTAIVAGGKERSDSVLNGLKCIADPAGAYVYVQDAARPMLTQELLLRLKEDVECFGTAVTGVKSKDTVKIVTEDGFVNVTPDRRAVWNIQTPQAFKADDLIDAYSRYLDARNVAVTDDSSVMEMFGCLPVHITEGDYSNLKITTAEDFEIARIFIDRMAQNNG